MWGLARPVGLLLALGCVIMAAWTGATRWRPSTSTYQLQGIDVPLDTAPVDWGSVRASGADFAYLVATAGAHRRDPNFEANWGALPEAGLRRGAVHLYALCEPAEAQANAFNTFVPRSDDALPAAVDVSMGDDCPDPPDAGALIAGVTRFVRMVEAHTSKPVILRVARPVEASYHLTAALNRPVWTMGNFLSPGYAAHPWRLWRASTVAHVEGVQGPVNWDVVAP